MAKKNIPKVSGPLDKAGGFKRAASKSAAGSVLTQSPSIKRTASNYALETLVLRRAPGEPEVMVRAHPTMRGGAEVKPRTLRLNEPNDAGLRLLHAIFGVPVNRLVNEAVGEFIVKRANYAETRLSDVVEALKAYRERDPTFEADKMAFIDGELRHGTTDPMEGVAFFIEDVAPGSTERQRPAGRALYKVRELLRR